MNISEVKIEDKLMDMLIQMFFIVPKINMDRLRGFILGEDKWINPFNPEEQDEFNMTIQNIPELVMSVDYTIDIPEKDALKFIEMWNNLSGKPGEEHPYFTLVSDNAENGLEVYLKSFSYKTLDKSDKSVRVIEPISVNDLYCKSRYFIKEDEGKYRFD